MDQWLKGYLDLVCLVGWIYHYRTECLYFALQANWMQQQLVNYLQFVYLVIWMNLQEIHQEIAELWSFLRLMLFRLWLGWLLQ